MKFIIEKLHLQSRKGKLILNHGVVNTPFFMPVGTGGSVKGLTPDELESVNTEIILSNTYHLYLKPGHKLIKEAGGIHKFMGWNLPILTDSGGYQVMSMGNLSKIHPSGIEFISHIDVSKHMFTPELVFEIQKDLNSDIAMVLDVCTKYPYPEQDLITAHNLTIKWAKKFKEIYLNHLNENPDYENQQVAFAIVQGGTDLKLRKENAEELIALDFPGYAIGSTFVGEPKEKSWEIVSEIAKILPVDKPRYLMGAGYPEDIVLAVSLGIDMMDCVIPTRNGRNGMAFSKTDGKINIRNSKYKTQYNAPVDENCSCPSCKKFSKAYIHHLFKIGEYLGGRLLTIHNIYFYNELMKTIREQINSKTFNGIESLKKASYNFENSTDY